MTKTILHSLETETLRHVRDLDPRIAAVNTFWRRAGHRQVVGKRAAL